MVGAVLWALEVLQTWPTVEFALPHVGFAVLLPMLLSFEAVLAHQSSVLARVGLLQLCGQLLRFYDDAWLLKHFGALLHARDLNCA